MSVKLWRNFCVLTAHNLDNFKKNDGEKRQMTSAQRLGEIYELLGE